MHAWVYMNTSLSEASRAGSPAPVPGMVTTFKRLAERVATCHTSLDKAIKEAQAVIGRAIYQPAAFSARQVLDRAIKAEDAKLRLSVSRTTSTHHRFYMAGKIVVQCIMELDAHRRELEKTDELASCTTPGTRDISPQRMKVEFERLREEHAVALKVNEGPEL